MDDTKNTSISPSPKESVLASALKMASGTMSSRVLGLVRDMAFAAFFTREITDAWTAAFRLPNLFRRLLGEGSLSVSFIPVFVEKLQNKDGLQARDLASSFYTLLFCFLLLLSFCGIHFAPELLSALLDPNYVNDREKFLLTQRMAQIMFGFIFLISQFAFFMAILNALGEYAKPAFAPVLFNLAMILSTLVPQNLLPNPGDALAWGVLIGGGLQMAFLIPALVKRGYMPKFFSKRSWHWRDPGVLKILKNMAPGLLGTGLLQVTTLVNLRFASSLGEGPISYIYLSDRLLELPLSLVSVSLGTALLPTLAAYFAKGEFASLKDVSRKYLNLNLFVAIPAAVGLFVLAQPIVLTLFARGAFSLRDAEATADVLKISALILISSSCVRVFVPLYYAIQNTWFPAVVSAVCLMVHIFLAPYLMEKLALTGLMLSSFASASLNFVLLAASVRLFVGPFGFMEVFKKISVYSVCAFFMGCVLVLSLYFFPFPISGEFKKILVLAFLVLLGALVFTLSAHLMGLKEIAELRRRLSRKKV